MDNHYLQSIENYHPNRKSHFQSIITKPKPPVLTSKSRHQKKVFDYCVNDDIAPSLTNYGYSRNCHDFNTANSLALTKIKTISTAADSYSFLPKNIGTSRNVGVDSS